MLHGHLAAEWLYYHDSMLATPMNLLRTTKPPSFDPGKENGIGMTRPILVVRNSCYQVTKPVS